MKFLIMHGVNLNMFGKRDKSQYGTITLDEINQGLLGLARELNVGIDTFQSNDESEFIREIHKACASGYAGVVINAGAWTHYSHALADALEILPCPVVEVHMSNIFKREAFRAVSVISRVAAGTICGFGEESYYLGLRAAVQLARK